MHTLIVTFTLDGVDHAAFGDLANEVAPAFAGVPGLMAKVWLADEERGVYGGVYVFETEAAADAYLASDLFRRGVAGNPHFAGVGVRRAGVLASATTHTAGGLRLPAPAVD